MKSTSLEDHKKKCPYLKWLKSVIEYQPVHPLSELAREIMVEEICTCDEKETKNEENNM